MLPGGFSVLRGAVRSAGPRQLQPFTNDNPPPEKPTPLPRTRGPSGSQPLDADKIAAALKLVQAGLSPTAAARQVGLGRSTVYRELGRTGAERIPQPV